MGRLKLVFDVAFTLVCALIVGAILSNGWNKFRKRPEARVEMRRAFVQIPLRATPARVRKHFTANRYKELKLKALSPSLWMVTTPTEWGAKNWRLYLEWNTGQLVAKRVRTDDGPQIRPRDSPPRDEVRSGWNSPRKWEFPSS